MKSILPRFALLTLYAVLALCQSPVQASSSVPIGDFFRDPEFRNVSLSPTGEYITVSVPRGDRTVLAAFRVDGMKLVGKWDYGENRHIDRVRWVNDERFILYVTRKLGRFDFRVSAPDLYLSNVDGKKRLDIPNGGTYQIVDIDWDDPNTIIVQRSVDSAYLFKMNVYTGKTVTLASAPLRFGDFVLDSRHQVRYAIGRKDEDKLETVTLRRDGDDWTTVHVAPMGESVRSPLGFERDERHVLFEVSDAGEPTRLVRIEPESGAEEVLSRNPNVDIDGLLRSSDGRDVLAVHYTDGTPGYEFIAPDHPESKLLAGLINAFPDRAVTFAGMSRDGRFVLVRAYSDIDPGAYYLFDRKLGKATFLLAAMDWIKPETMSPMQPFTFVARDGTSVHGYITIPRGSDGKNLSLILHPHGGPHGVRDDWGFDPEVQFLANRGHAVLQVNFRGSGGYGNAFERKGYRNWGTSMIDDMADAVDWAVARGIVDPQRVCTYGASYGGYAALQAVVRNPDKYQCTIGYAGVFSIPMLFKEGDIPRSDAGKAFLRRVQPEETAEQQAQSPAFNVDKIHIPVMLVQGGKDERTPPAQYNLLKDAMAKTGKAPEVDIFEPKEGHGFYDHDNQVRLYTAIEAFLANHIGRKPN